VSVCVWLMYIMYDHVLYSDFTGNVVVECSVKTSWSLVACVDIPY
jgi:hypothetical protein